MMHDAFSKPEKLHFCLMNNLCGERKEIIFANRNVYFVSKYV